MSITRKKLAAISIFVLLLIALPLLVITLQKQNDPRSRAQFTINLLAPTSESKVTGTSVTIAAQTNLALGHHGMEFYVDGSSVGQDNTVPYLIQWDSTTAVNGKHTIVAKEINEFDPTNQRTSQTISVLVENNPGDKKAEAINAVELETVQDTFASVSWETTDKTTAEVIYGKTAEKLTKTPQSSILTDDHTVPLTNLEPNTQYTYQVKSTDAAGNTTLSDPETFVTATDNNAVTGEWKGAPGWNFATVNASLLYTGEVLLWSWNTQSDGTRVWNPTTNAFTTISMSNNIFCSGLATLPDGRVFAAGGHINNSVGTKNTNIFDPATRKWTAGPMMRDGRWYPTVTVLPDGRTVIMTGDIDGSRKANIPEVYNPKTNTLTALTNIQTTSLVGYSSTFATGTNKVVAISYYNSDMHILDVDAKTWVNKGKALNQGGAAAQYRPGKILMSGGKSGSGSSKNSAVVDVNTANPSWRSVAPMKYPRYFHNLVNLPDGQVLAVGGSDKTDPNTNTTSAPLANEIWNPQTEQWTTVAPLSVRRMYHSTAILLPDGRVLASGGRNGTGENTNAEFYSPPYLFKGARPTITNAPQTINKGATITIQTPNAASISKVNILSLAAQTHTHDMNQRFVELSFTKTTSGLQVQVPNDTSTLPEGYYMIFILNAEGVPSVAKIVKLSTDTPAPTAPYVTPTPTGVKYPTTTPTQAPYPTATKAPTPTVTKAPTTYVTPTKTPSATPKPTVKPQPTATPTVVPTYAPTPTKAPYQTSLEFNLFLHGIGKGGDNTNKDSGGNANPVRKQRPVEVTIYNANRTVAATVSATMVYNPQLGNYQGSVIIPNLSTDIYQFTFRSDGYLRRSIPGAQTITKLSQNNLPSLPLVTGDTNVDNKISILDYNRILDCFSDLDTAKNCASDKKVATDLNDDAQVNQFDYNLFLRELAVQSGE